VSRNGQKQKRRSWGFLWLIALLPAALALQYVGAKAPDKVEHIFSRGIYPVVSAAVSLVFGYIPFPVAEAALAALTAALIFAVTRRIYRTFRYGPAELLRGLARLAAFAGVMYFLFVAMWGLNYERVPLEKTLGLTTAAPTKTELAAALDKEIADVNALCPSVTYTSLGTSAYPGGFNEMKDRVNAGFDALSSPLTGSQRYFAHTRSHPKGIWLSQYMSYTGIQGIFIPYTCEPCIVTDYPQCVLPFTISHETAHLKGYAREDEANYLGYLACAANPDAYYQYSGHLNALTYLSDALYSTDPVLWRTEISKLDRRAAADVNVYYKYLRDHSGKAQSAADKINDSYLKAQGQTGVVSYDRFVTLLCAQYNKTN
jgi:hypothetical protein